VGLVLPRLVNSDEIFNPFVISHCRSSKLLNARFREYNKIYFGGMLPKFKVLRCSKPKNYGHEVAGYCSPRERRILIRNGLGEKSTLQTLAHEMIHAKLSESKTKRKNEVHGSSFVNELKRLRALGAPLSPQDLDKKKDRKARTFSEVDLRKLISEAHVVERLTKVNVPKFLERELQVPFSIIERKIKVSHIIREIYG
jgi:hypothetical protein